MWEPGWLNEVKAGTVDRASFLAAIHLVPSLLEIAGVKPTEDVRFDGVALPEVLLG